MCNIYLHVMFVMSITYVMHPYTNHTEIKTLTCFHCNLYNTGGSNVSAGTSGPTN